MTTLFVTRVIQKLSGPEHKSDSAGHRTLGHRRPFRGIAFGVVRQQAVVFQFGLAALLNKFELTKNKHNLQIEIKKKVRTAGQI